MTGRLGVLTMWAIIATVTGVGCATVADGEAGEPSNEPMIDATTPSSTSTQPAATVPIPAPTALATSSPTSPSTTVSTTPTTSPTLPPTTSEPVVRSGAESSTDEPVGDPIAISIPAIDVYSAVVPTGVLDDGTVAVPPDPAVAGWFTGGSRPGERGPAVIVGHVDSRVYGPGVFYDLVELPVGSVVTVETTTGPVEFVVQSVEQFPKDEFPTQRVYGPVPEPALRLITCGGSFDRSIRHYRDNIVAFLIPV